MGGRKQKRNPNIDRFIRQGEKIAFIMETVKMLNVMVEVYNLGGGNEESDEMVEDMLLDIRDACKEIVRDR
jgi:hypothetical protein